MAIGRRQHFAPMAAVATVMVIAVGSAAVWMACARVPAETGEPGWWPGSAAVPTR